MKQTITNFILRAIFAISAAAGLAAAANAQMASVFVRTTLSYANHEGSTRPLSVNSVEFVENYVADFGPTNGARGIARVSGGMTITASPIDTDSNRLFFGTERSMAGDVVRIACPPPDETSCTPMTTFVFRVYATGGELFFAEPVRLARTVNSADNEFFLDSDAMPVDTIADGLIGYVAPPNCGTGTTGSPNADNMCECAANFVNLDTEADPQTCEASPDDAPPPDMQVSMTVAAPVPSAQGGASEKGERDYSPFFAGGIGVLLLANAIVLSQGDADAFSFAPDFGYAISESGYSYKYGGRVDFRKDAWSLYWTAGQRNSDGEFGDFRYESGGEYDGGIWKAAFSESVRGDVADYDFSLSADYAGGIWKISPEFAADARYKNGEFATTNSFRISGELRFDDWRFAASGSAERVRLSAVREF